MDEDVTAPRGPQETIDFDVVLRGYDRPQVLEYVQWAEALRADVERQDAEHAERVAALETQLQALRSRMAEAEERAAGLPEPASRLTQRLASMLALAEQEAEQILEQAREQARRTTAERTVELDRRAAEVASAAELAEQTRLEAQRDAEAVRAKAQQDAAATLEKAKKQADQMAEQVRQHGAAQRKRAEQDGAALQEQARKHAAEITQQAQRQVAEMGRQKDAIAVQLQALRETLSAVGPLGGPEAGA